MRFTSDHGFTIIEIVIVMTIGIILLSMGMSLSNTYLSNQRLQGAADDVRQALEQAQIDSFTQRDGATHGVKVLTNQVVRFEGSSYAARNQAKDVVTPFPATVAVSGSSEVVFIPATPKPTALSTITVTFGTRAVDITVSAYGIIQ